MKYLFKSHKVEQPQPPQSSIAHTTAKSIPRINAHSIGPLSKAIRSSRECIVHARLIGSEKGEGKNGALWRQSRDLVACGLSSEAAWIIIPPGATCSCGEHGWVTQATDSLLWCSFRPTRRVCGGCMRHSTRHFAFCWLLRVRLGRVSRGGVSRSN